MIEAALLIAFGLACAVVLGISIGQCFHRMHPFHSHKEATSQPRMVRRKSSVQELGEIVDSRNRGYLGADETLSLGDLLMVAEIAFFWALAEGYMSLFPALGFVSGKPIPYAHLVTRELVFFGSPICYMAMYAMVCGTIHFTYTRLWPEEGKRLSIQNKPMKPEELRKAILFSVKSMTSTCGISVFFYYAVHGWTNIRWGMPELREIPWFIIGYILIDINAYLVHRALHTPFLYARVHKVHHLWKSPNVFVVSALHPFEFLALAFGTCAVMCSLPISFPVFCGTFVLIFTCNAMDHSGMHLENLPLNRLLFWQAHPEFHDNHHAFFHVNYGAMVDWWDRLGGSYYHPKEHGVIGVGEKEFASVRELQQKARSDKMGG